MERRTWKSGPAFVAALFGVFAFLPPASSGAPSVPAGPEYLYKATFVRAAPGRLLDLITLIKGRMAELDAAGDERPLWWRHTQGDQWDLMLLAPMGSYAEYYAKDRIARRQRASSASPLPEKEYRSRLDDCSSWKEDVFVMGPQLPELRKAAEGMAYFHIEIFIALPGKRAELHKEREMENAYQVGVGRPATLVFLRDQGAAWDLFSLGCYRDLKHWADSGEASKEKRQEAARRAGFKDSDAIGPYMRTLIDMHRDTMGVAIK